MSADPIYTLADLDTWSFPGTALAVLGHPIKHSVSPPMLNAALAESPLEAQDQIGQADDRRRREQG